MTMDFEGVRELTLDEIDEVNGGIGLPGAIGGAILGFASGVTSAVAGGGSFGDAVVGGATGAVAGGIAGATGNVPALVGITFAPAAALAANQAAAAIDRAAGT